MQFTQGLPVRHCASTGLPCASCALSWRASQHTVWLVACSNPTSQDPTDTRLPRLPLSTAHQAHSLAELGAADACGPQV